VIQKLGQLGHSIQNDQVSKHFQLSLSFSRLYNRVSECQQKKITKNLTGENFTASGLARDLLQSFPTYGGFFHFPSDGGFIPQKPRVV
jgi:hypothetical protein